jgi:hypothetical protein
VVVMVVVMMMSQLSLQPIQNVAQNKPRADPLLLHVELGLLPDI